MFATSSLARRIERAEVEQVAAAAAASARRVGADRVVNQPIAGGVAVLVERGCPFNKIAGLGFGGVPEDRVLERLERTFAERGVPLQAEVSTLADPAVSRLLTRRGYELVGFENVLGLDLTGWIPTPASAREPIEVRRTGPDDGQLLLQTVVTGFLHPDIYDGSQSHESFARESLERIFRDMIGAEGLEHYLARRDGVIAGGASLRLVDRVALLCGAATLPEHRRRGVQSALTNERLRSAGERGCDIAVVTTTPGSKSQANVERIGFALLYARAILVKDGRQAEPRTRRPSRSSASAIASVRQR